MSDGSNTARNSGKATGKPFTKGDPRINRNGRPRKFDQLQNLAQSIAHEVAIGRDGLPIAINGHTVTVTEAILRQWARDPKQQELFMKYAFGNIPQRQEVSIEKELLEMLRDKRITLSDIRAFFPDVALPVPGIEA